MWEGTQRGRIDMFWYDLDWTMLYFVTDDLEKVKAGLCRSDVVVFKDGFEGAFTVTPESDTTSGEVGGLH